MQIYTILKMVALLLAGAFIVLVTVFFLTGCDMQNPLGDDETEQSVTVRTSGESTILVHTEGDDETEVSVEGD